jgi:hypothetical protein
VAGASALPPLELLAVGFGELPVLGQPQECLEYSLRLDLVELATFLAIDHDQLVLDLEFSCFARASLGLAGAGGLGGWGGVVHGGLHARRGFNLPNEALTRWFLRPGRRRTHGANLRRRASL